MPWNSINPDGTKSVKANRPRLQENTTYIETTMGNSVIGTNTTSTRDHFWNVGSDEDGRHRFVQSPAFTVGGIPTDPVLGTGMGLVSYAKTKSSAESPAQQDVQPFARNGSAIMQILGIRACVVFSIEPNTDVTINYAHNIASVVRLSSGKYTITYTTPLPSNNYLVLGGAIRDTDNLDSEQFFTVRGGDVLNNTKSTTKVEMMSYSLSGTFRDPLQAWAVCFGG